jgi:hypothetical protein
MFITDEKRIYSNPSYLQQKTIRQKLTYDLINHVDITEVRSRLNIFNYSIPPRLSSNLRPAFKIAIPMVSISADVIPDILGRFYFGS